MKNIKYFAACLIAGTSLALASCDQERIFPKADAVSFYSSITIPETDYHADAENVYLLRGQSLQLSYIATPENVTAQGVKWTSSDASIVTVTENGLITAQNAVGNAVIQLTPAIGFGAAQTTPAVTVHVIEQYVYMDSVKITNELAPGNLIDVGQSYQLVASYATISGDAVTFEKYTWTSSDVSIATVDARTGLVTGVAQGNVTITCRADDQNPTPVAETTVTTAITVRQPVAIETFDLIPDTELSALGYGQQYNIQYTVTPANATVSAIVWTSDNASAISVDNTGKLSVHATDGAIATITATAGNIVRTVNVAVAQGRFWYSFATGFSPWRIDQAGAVLQGSDGTKTTIAMNNPNHDGSKHRGDIALVKTADGNIVSVYPKEYPLLAVKIRVPSVLAAGNNSQGTIKLEMFDDPRTIGPNYMGTINSANNSYTVHGGGAITTDAPNVIVFNLLTSNWDGGFTTGQNPYSLKQFKFVIADFPAALPWIYDIYWVRSFKTQAELDAFVAAGN